MYLKSTVEPSTELIAKEVRARAAFRVTAIVTVTVTVTVTVAVTVTVTVISV